MRTGLGSDPGLLGVNSHSICIMKSGTQPNCSTGMVQKVLLIISNQAGMSAVSQTLCICVGANLTWSFKKTVKFQSLFIHTKKRTFCKFRGKEKLTLCIILSILKLNRELSFYIKTQICGKSIKAEILNLVAKRKFYKYP